MDCKFGQSWSKTFNCVAEEHELRPTTFRKEQELHTAFMSLIRFCNGQFKLVIHEGARIGKFNEEGIWLSPVKNRQFNDSVASVDRRLLEKAKQIHQTRPARATAGEEGEDVAQVKLKLMIGTINYKFRSSDLEQRRIPRHGQDCWFLQSRIVCSKTPFTLQITNDFSYKD